MPVLKQFNYSKKIIKIDKSWYNRLSKNNALECFDPRCINAVNGKPREFNINDIAYIKYTSGGTSKKKKHKLAIYCPKCARMLNLYG